MMRLIEYGDTPRRVEEDEAKVWIYSLVKWGPSNRIGISSASKN